MTYRCEQCRASRSREVTAPEAGMCLACGWPMRIEDVFSDRRIVSVPVLVDRRLEHAAVGERLD
ncbi:MAG: hypothetical protein ACJ76Z_16400 [Thermoleophilaceae bacterium]